MKQSANATVSNKSTNVKTATVTKINLSQFADKLKNVELKVKEKKALLYKYPENFNANDINSDKGKKFRSSLRTKLKRFTNNIFVFAKINEVEKLKKEIKDFESFYKENFVVNDLTVRSITNSKDTEASVTLMLQIIKEVKK
jgi:predicted translin family RNA/ssDNA-binding protein